VIRTRAASISWDILRRVACSGIPCSGASRSRSARRGCCRHRICEELARPPGHQLYLGEKSGSYGPMMVYQRDNQQRVVGSFPARHLRLKVENTGLSSIKACSGYIIGITEHASAIRTNSQQEVVTLGWANHGLGARDIPRGASSTWILLRCIRVAHEMPRSLEPLFSGGTAHSPAPPFETLPGPIHQ
jgi:hypothetical protein